MNKFAKPGSTMNVSTFSLELLCVPVEISVPECTVSVMLPKVYFLQIVMWMNSMHYMGFIEAFVYWFCNGNFLMLINHNM